MQIYGTRAVATIGTRKHITITYPAPRETLLDIPVELPTSEPVDPLITLTVESGDMPALTGITADGVTQIATIVVAGANLVQTGQTLNYGLYKNGVLVGDVTTGTFSNAYYTIQSFAPDATVGDVFGVKLWTDNPGEMNVDYSALFVSVTQPHGGPVGTVLLGVHYTNFEQRPVLTLGAPDYNNPRSASADNGDHDSSIELYDGITLKAFAISPTNLYRISWGDRLTGVFVNDQYTRPYYDPNMVVGDVAYYPTSLRVL